MATDRKNYKTTNPVSVLRFKQWLDIWSEYRFDDKAHSRRPEPYIYLFSMSAAQLRGNYATFIVGNN